MRCTVHRYSLAAGAALLIASAATAHADSIFNLVNVSFTQGGGATGYFEYDSQTSQVVSWSISTTGGNGFNSSYYANLDSSAWANSGGCSFLFTGPAGLALCFDTGAPAGEVYPLLSASNETSPSATRYTAGGVLVDPQNNQGSGVPEPSTIELALTAFLLYLACTAWGTRHHARFIFRRRV